ncbi:MAG: anti-sigma factor [Gemmatimonadota bacterium]
MNPHRWFEEHRTAYVTRSLERDEMTTFSEHLAGCAECREAIRTLEQELAWLPMGVAPVTVRPGLQRRIVEHVLGNNQWRWNRMTTLAVAASLLLAILTYGIGRQQLRSLDRERAVLAQQASIRQNRLAALEDTVSVMRGATRILQASFQMENRDGGLLIFADARTHRWNVVVHGLPPAGPDQVYQFWFIEKDGMVRGAVVQPDSAGPTFMMMGMPPGGGEVMGAALTVEPMDRQTTEPQGKMLAHLML